MLRFNRYYFLLLTLFSHITLGYILYSGSFLQVSVIFSIFIFECLFSSTVIYHRLLTHRSWKAPRWLEKFGTIVGIFTFTGTSITRTLSHRYHHAYTDQDRDPHSPSVVGLFYTYFPMLKYKVKMDLRLVSDLIQDPFHVWIHVNYLKIILLTVIIACYLFGIKWGLAVFVAPGALCWMNVSICNMFCHYGKSNQRIVNNWLLAWITFGEGWHLNHHLEPINANFGGKRFDFGYWLIKKLERLNNFNRQ